MNIRNRNFLTQTFNQLINYTKTYGKHNIEALLGHENYSYRLQYNYGMKTNEIVSGTYEYSNFVSISSMDSYTREYKKEGYFARLNYDFDDKYYVTASYRRDGSSRFSKDNRWGNFWSFGASWRISQEDFMENLTWVDNLKLRASYGETGNDAIYYTDDDTQQDYYPYQTLYNLGINNGLEAGLYFPTMANNNLKWETQVSTDVALEFGLFGRLNGTVEFFRKASRDLLFNVSQPLSSGVEKIVQNIGKVRNQGVEIDLNYQVLKSKDWKLSVGANATFINNKVTRLPDANRKDGIIKDSKKLMEGHSIYEFWLRQWWGVNPDNGDGLYIFDDTIFPVGIRQTSHLIIDERSEEHTSELQSPS